MPAPTPTVHVPAIASRFLALAALGLVAACVNAKPKPAEPGPGPAAVPAAAPSPGPEADSLRVYLMTFGPGEAVWEHFGHSAIWVHDPARGTDQAYNYGMFDFKQAHFYRRLIEGNMLYWMEGFDARLFADVYIQEDRSVWLQELALTPAQRAALRDFLVWNDRPENRFYGYDYFRDGCSTRVRDALDRLLGGAIRAQTERTASGSTYRSHSLALVQDDPWAYTGITLGLGRPTDLPISLWEQMFLPLELRETLRRITVPAADGRRVPLVAAERTLYESTRPPPSRVPPRRTGVYLLVGLALALALAGLAEAAGGGRATAYARDAGTPDPAAAQPAPAREKGRSAHGRSARRRLRSRDTARAGLALLAVMWALVSGLFGAVIVFLWAGTAHVTSYHNENVLQFDVLALALVVLVPAALYGVRRATRPARVLALAIAALSLLGFLLKATPWFWQVNGPIVALALPANLGLGWALWRATHSRDRP